VLKKILPFIAIVLFAACNKPNTDINQFKWLEGKWEGNENGATTFEEWYPIKGTTIMGTGGVYSEKDTLFSEKIRIELTDGELYYVAAVPGNPHPVAFKLIKSEKDSTTFENPQHDFPQRIIYSKNADGSLYARIEGKRSGKFSKQEFSFKRIN